LIGVHQQEIDWVAGRLREQARSYSWAGYTRKKLVGWQADLFAIERVPCRSELAREKRLDNTINQAARVIVDVHREQARSYRAER
jgi:hypothetical protein